jgi:hypothetical protein
MPGSSSTIRIDMRVLHWRLQSGAGVWAFDM